MRMPRAYTNGRRRDVSGFLLTCFDGQTSHQWGSSTQCWNPDHAGVVLAVIGRPDAFGPTAGAPGSAITAIEQVDTTLYALRATDIWTTIALLLITALTVTALITARRAAAMSREMTVRREIEADIRKLNAVL